MADCVDSTPLVIPAPEPESGSEKPFMVKGLSFLRNALISQIPCQARNDRAPWQEGLV